MDSPESRPPRRKRYAGKNPRRFEDKYKEHRQDAETLERVMASGKTPAGMHRPIMVQEVLLALRLQPGETVVDATLGYGGHAAALLEAVQPGGCLVAVDVDPHELPRTEARLRERGFPADSLLVRRSNFAGLPRVLTAEGRQADALLADLGVSSMQIDNPARGFTWKSDGPVDMRLNPERGESAGALLRRIAPGKLEAMLEANADEPHAAAVARALAGRDFAGTLSLAAAIRAAVPPDADDRSVRRVFQALRIAVNDEFSALDSLLRNLPDLLRPGGRAAILTFHSGEDRRVKRAFAAGLDAGLYEQISASGTQATPGEMRENPRSTSARLRWALRA